MIKFSNILNTDTTVVINTQEQFNVLINLTTFNIEGFIPGMVFYFNKEGERNWDRKYHSTNQYAKNTILNAKNIQECYDELIRLALIKYKPRTKFKDLVNNRVFEVRESTFDNYDNRNVIYVKVCDSTFNNKSACIYKDGNWAPIEEKKLEDSLYHALPFPNNDYYLIEVIENISKNNKFIPKGTKTWASEHYINTKNPSAYLLVENNRHGINFEKKCFKVGELIEVNPVKKETSGFIAVHCTTNAEWDQVISVIPNTLDSKRWTIYKEKSLITLSTGKFCEFGGMFHNFEKLEIISFEQWAKENLIGKWVIGINFGFGLAQVDLDIPTQIVEIGTYQAKVGYKVNPPIGNSNTHRYMGFISYDSFKIVGNEQPCIKKINVSEITTYQCLTPIPNNAVILEVVKDIIPSKLDFVNCRISIIPKGAKTWSNAGNFNSDIDVVFLEDNRWEINIPRDYFKVIDRVIETEWNPKVGDWLYWLAGKAIFQIGNSGFNTDPNYYKKHSTKYRMATYVEVELEKQGLIFNSKHSQTSKQTIPCKTNEPYELSFEKLYKKSKSKVMNAVAEIAYPVETKLTKSKSQKTN